MKTLELIEEVNSYDTASYYHKNLGTEAEVIAEIKSEFNIQSEYVDQDDNTHLKVEVDACHHEHDCCGCLCSHGFVVKYGKTEQHLHANL
jgi:hypothetical protein